MADEQVAFQWLAPDADAYDETAAVIKAEGGQVEEPSDRELAFIPIIIGVILVSGLVRAVDKAIRDRKRPGLVIDTRYKPVHIREEKRLSADTVIIINAKGVETKVERPEPDELQRLVEAALGAAGGGGSSGGDSKKSEGGDASGTEEPSKEG